MNWVNSVFSQSSSGANSTTPSSPAAHQQQNTNDKKGSIKGSSITSGFGSLKGSLTKKQGAQSTHSSPLNSSSGSKKDTPTRRRNSILGTFTSSSVPNATSSSQHRTNTQSSQSLCNDLIDNVLNYVKKNYATQFDPYKSDDKVKIDLGSWASIIMTECTIYGGSHFERCGNFNVKSHSSDDITVAGLIKFENLDGQIKFDAKFGKPGTRMTLRDKTLLLGLSSICIYIEIAINYKKQTVRVTQITVMSIDGLDGKSSGLAWPLSKIADKVIERQLSQWKSNSQRNADQIKLFLNQYSSQWNLSDILSHINFSELLD